jgi:hypothetical protein
MKMKLAFLPVFLIILSPCLRADNIAAGQGSPDAVTFTASAVPVSPASAPAPYFRNAAGLEIYMPGYVIPGISYSRYIYPDFFATVFIGLLKDSDGFDPLVSINGYKMIGDYFYAGLGIGAIIDPGDSMLISLANPTIGLMAGITPEIKFYVETTTWLFKFTTNSDWDASILSTDTIIIFKAGVKYYFSWADPLPNIRDMQQ